MHASLLDILRCPVTRSSLTLQSLSYFPGTNEIEEGILFANEDWFYPITKGVPRLTVEAFIDYKEFFEKNLPGYSTRRETLINKNYQLVQYVTKKNRRTKQSFAQEWRLFNYEQDKTWNKDNAGLMTQFLEETAESRESLKGKLVFDAGCGNGVLDQSIAQAGAHVIAMDFSQSIEKAFELNTQKDAQFIQGDVQFPPVAFQYFDIVHCSGVLIHTNNTEHSFSCIDPCVKIGGKMSVWLYHPRKNFIHRIFNFIRTGTSKLPLRFQYYFYSATIFPVSFIVKRLKGNKQNRREMMIDILDWFSPEFRWEHEPSEAESWFRNKNYTHVQITTTSTFGFNITGIKG